MTLYTKVILDQFWSSLAKEEIQWIKEFKSICTGDAPFYEWFKEGKLNISENCSRSAYK